MFKSNNYKMENIVGKGAFGIVYSATHALTGERVAVKIINMKQSSVPPDKIMNEVDQLKILHHPNIVQYREHFIENDNFFIVTELIEGKDIEALLEEQAESLEESLILKIFFQLASALKYLHSQNILHRDIKSRNILLTASFDAKLIDFGISKMLDSNTGFAETNCGTIYWMAPEILTGKPYSFSCDVWSLGVVVHQMMTLHVPFQDPTIYGLVNKIMSEELGPLPEKYSQEFKEIVRGMLVKDASCRIKISKVIKHSKLFSKLIKEFEQNQANRLNFLENENRILKEQVQLMTFSSQDLVQKYNQLVLSFQELQLKTNQGSPPNDEFQPNIETEKLSTSIPTSSEPRTPRHHHRDREIKIGRTRSQTQVFKAGNFLSNYQENPSALVSLALKTLRENRFDINVQKENFEILKAAADANNLEACWMVAACYIRSIGTSEDIDKAREYAKKSMIGGIGNGTYWFGRSFNNVDGSSFFKKALDQGSLSGRNHYGTCLYKGEGVKKDKTEGINHKLAVLQSGDRYWTLVHAYYYQNGLYGYKKSSKSTSKLIESSKTQKFLDEAWIFNPEVLPDEFFKHCFE